MGKETGSLDAVDDGFGRHRVGAIASRLRDRHGLMPRIRRKNGFPPAAPTDVTR